PGARHAIADGELFGAPTDMLHHPGARVPERNRLVETTEHRLDGRTEPVLLHLVDDLAHEVRPLPRLAQQRFAGELDGHALGARADQRRDIPNDDPAGFRMRLRDFRNLELTRANVLEN